MVSTIQRLSTHYYCCFTISGLKSSGSTMKSTEVLSKEEIAEICKRKDDDIELTHDRMKGVGYKRLVMNISIYLAIV